MTFAELLKTYIGNRTLEEVVDAAAEKGVQIDAPLLSRMRNGTRLPPKEDETVTALAEVCGADPAPLLLLARLERHPHETYPHLLRQAIDAAQAARSISHTHFETARQVGEWIRDGVAPEHISDRLDSRIASAAHTHYNDHLVFEQFTRTLRFLDLDPRDPVTDLERKLPAGDIPKIGRTEAEILEELAEVSGVPRSMLSELLAAGKNIAGAIKPE